jgi:hypothetical protein
MNAEARAENMPARARVSLAAAVTTLAAAGVALAAAVLPARDQGTDADPGRLELAVAGGLRLTNSKQGEWVVRAGHLLPGQSRQGRVAIGVSGSAARVQLRPEQGSGATGPYGGPLDAVLRVQVSRPWAKQPANRRVFYNGTLAAMPAIALGSFQPASVRRYRIRVTLPDSGVPPSPQTGDNVYQGSSADVSFVWEAVGGGA